MPDVSQYLHDLSSSEPVPGGGAAAALAGAMGASLLAMVARLTFGRKRFADVQRDVADLLGEAEGLRDRMIDLVSADEDAYRMVAEALALPRGTDEQRKTRQDALQDALKGAAQPPLDVMRTSSEIVRLGARLVQIGNPSAISDVGTGALLATAAYHGGRLNVDANLVLIRDERWVQDLEQVIRGVPEPDGWNAEVQSRVHHVLSPETA